MEPPIYKNPKSVPLLGFLLQYVAIPMQKQYIYRRIIATTMKNTILSLLSLLVLSCAASGDWKTGDGATVKNGELALASGDRLTSIKEYRNFIMSGKAFTAKGAEASLLFHTDGESGYEVILHNGAIDGTRKTGSLAAVRNLYRSLAEDSCWFDFQVAVRGKNIAVSINGIDVVCYTEPDAPYRTAEYA